MDGIDGQGRARALSRRLTAPEDRPRGHLGLTATSQGEQGNADWLWLSAGERFGAAWMGHLWDSAAVLERVRGL